MPALILNENNFVIIKAMAAGLKYAQNDTSCHGNEFSGIS